MFEKLKQEFVTSQLLRNSDVIIAMLKKEQKILCKKQKRERWYVGMRCRYYLLHCCTEPSAIHLSTEEESLTYIPTVHFNVYLVFLPIPFLKMKFFKSQAEKPYELVVEEVIVLVALKQHLSSMI